MANIARYHRGSEPKKKHENFERMAAADQLRVRRLTAILRIAGGLDRSHTQQVQNLRLELSPERGTLWVQAAQDPELDVWGARRRVEMFERTFDLPLAIEWQASE